MTNTGNVTLDPVTVDDPKVGTVTCPVTTLAPDASTTCTATYTLTQTDVDAGVVNNTAIAYGNPPGGDPADTADDASAPDSTSTPIIQTPSITLDKQASGPTGNNAGATIDYTFLLTNTGNVTLTNVGIADPKVGPVACPTTTLAPGASTTCTATYTLTQLDVDAGNVPNTAIATGTPPTGAPVVATDTTDTPIVPGPAITLDKQAGTPSGNNAGDTISYNFLVTNTGNVTLTNVVVDDPKVGVVTCPVTTLAPTESTTCTATYALTQADVDDGAVLNTATATGTDPNETDVSATDSVTVGIPPEPAITLDKQAIDPVGGSAGDSVDYTFTVTNTGNVTLTTVVVTDPMVGAVTCPVTTLASTESTTCTATYTLTQADVDAGEVVNTAIVTGVDPNQTEVSATDTVTTPITQTPGIALDKIATAKAPVAVGDTIDYTFVVTNTGNITLVDIEVSDPMLGTVTCPATTLAPGESMTCTAPPYTVTAQDVKNGQVDNQAGVVANAGDVQVADNDEVSIETGVPPKPKLELEKSSDANGPVRMGEVINYTFTVTNTGNVALTDVTVNDPMLGTVTCDKTTLKPGQSTTCTAPGYVVTQADVRAGVVRNTATAQGSYCPDGGKCSKATDADSLNVEVSRPPSLPDTGSPVSPSMLALAGSLLVAGIMLLVAGRRRAPDDA